MLVKASDSLVLLIDIQTRLAPAIEAADDVVAAARWVLDVASLCQVPVWITEHYPSGLGHTLAPLLTGIAANQVLEKIHFSAWREPAIKQQIAEAKRQQIVVLGTETHVCVLQTVLDLLAANFQVFVVIEAVGSRTAANKALALARLQQAGAVIISKEMLAFEWLERAGTDLFRQISKNYIV